MSTGGATANQRFARDVGPSDLVHVVGGGTNATFGGTPDAMSRPVVAPSGIVEFTADEMIVRVGAGTPVVELAHALAEHGQMVALPGSGPATVGGALAVGRSGLFQVGYGLVRDTLLEAQYVTPTGQLLQAGAPVVKNVSGFDLCRLLVGSLGTIGLMAEVVLRTRPLPPASQWLSGPLTPADILTIVTRPSSLVATSTSAYVCVEGNGTDVERLSAALQQRGMVESSGPPDVATRRRRTTVMGHETAGLASNEIALPLTGVVFLDPDTNDLDDRPLLAPGVEALNRSVRASFDPTLRFNRGRQPWRSASPRRGHTSHAPH
ncbi:MAG: FAD-binding protein [Acidimicrobiales bacterium]